MPLTFAGTIDHAAVLRAVDQLTDLVAVPGIVDAWEHESALPGMTLGGLTRHLVSQPECAVEFLRQPPPEGAQTLSLADYFARVDWLHAPVDSPENTSIRDDFNAMAAGGPQESRGVLAWSRGELPSALAGAGPAVFVPWQGCSLQVDDFLVCRLMEVVVHADDLAASLGRAAPAFDEEVLDPVLALLAVLAVRRHDQGAVVRALSRSERAAGPVSAF